MILVDTNVWSAALRAPAKRSPATDRLDRGIQTGEDICITGAILQELLQGFRDEKTFRSLELRMRAFPLIEPTWTDHVFAAAIFRRCRGEGAQISTIDAQIASVAIAHECELLTTDRDFDRLAKLYPLRLC